MKGLSILDANDLSTISCCLKSVTKESLCFVFGDPDDFQTITGLTPDYLIKLGNTWPDVDVENRDLCFAIYVWLDYLSEKAEKGQDLVNWKEHISCSPEDVLLVASKWKAMRAS